MSRFSTSPQSASRASSAFKVTARDERSEFAQFAGLLLLVLAGVALLAGAAWVYFEQQTALAWAQASWSQTCEHIRQWLAAAPAPSAAVLGDGPLPVEVLRPGLAQCAGGTPQAAQLASTVTSLVDGPLGKALGLLMMLMGGALAVAKNSPLPALPGAASALFLWYGPSVVMSVMGC